MTRRTILQSACFAPAARLAFAFGQEGGRKRISPHETVSLSLGADNISISYGRPYLKGRKVGGEVAPFGKVWRLGADEATKLTVTAATKLGSSTELAAGSYALFAIPGDSKWTIIVNKTADQWGAFKYDQAQDLGRFDVPVTKPSSPVEQFTISFGEKSSNSAQLTMAWGNQSVSMPVTVG